EASTTSSASVGSAGGSGAAGGGGGAGATGGSGGSQAASSGSGGRPTSLFCGDAIRDPVTEECDDGNLDDADSCTTACLVRDLPAVPLPTFDPQGGRGLGG